MQSEDSEDTKNESLNVLRHSIIAEWKRYETDWRSAERRIFGLVRGSWEYLELSPVDLWQLVRVCRSKLAWPLIKMVVKHVRDVSQSCRVALEVAHRQSSVGLIDDAMLTLSGVLSCGLTSSVVRLRAWSMWRKLRYRRYLAEPFREKSVTNLKIADSWLSVTAWVFLVVGSWILSFMGGWPQSIALPTMVLAIAVILYLVPTSVYYFLTLMPDRVLTVATGIALGEPHVWRYVMTESRIAVAVCLCFVCVSMCGALYVAWRRFGSVGIAVARLSASIWIELIIWLPLGLSAWSLFGRWIISASGTAHGGWTDMALAVFAFVSVGIVSTCVGVWRSGLPKSIL